jgi:hypothetical protein
LVRDEHSLFDDRPHETVIDEVTDELSRRHLIDVHCRHPGCIPVLCEEFGFESLVTVSCIIEYAWTSHGIHAHARRRALRILAPINTPIERTH